MFFGLVSEFALDNMEDSKDVSRYYELTIDYIMVDLLSTPSLGIYRTTSSKFGDDFKTIYSANLVEWSKTIFGIFVQ